MEIELFQLDAFTDHLFGGNPAAVCVLASWLPDDILQKIASENNLSETAFITLRDDNYHIRWFTPECEVDLCGHATLAAAYVVLHYLEPNRQVVTFYSLSGDLTINLADNNYLKMDFPALEFKEADQNSLLEQALGVKPLEVYQSKDCLVVVGSEKEVKDVAPQLADLNKLDFRGIIVTAKGEHVDFVSRYFAPRCGVSEDPATGSAHCILAPYWSEKLGKTHLHAKQLSKRQGEIFCEVVGARVLLTGKVIPYLQGKITLR
jgi:PhzF family phenazine biosynthesis protein